MSIGLLIALASLSEPPAQVLLSMFLPSMKVGVAYNGSVSAVNAGSATGPIVIGIDNLPAGLSLGATQVNGDGSYSAQVTGTPTTAQSVNATISADNGNQSSRASYLFVVSASANIALTTSLPIPYVGVSYSGYVHGTNTGGASGALVYAANTLPAGLSIDPSTGNVTGTPTTVQAINTSFSVTNGSQTVYYAHAFNVNNVGTKVATVTGSLSDGTQINVSAPQGSRVQLVPGTLLGSVIFHADGYSVCIENAYAGLTNDLIGTFTVAVDGVTLWSGSLTIWAYSRTRPFWVSTPPLKSSPELWRFPTYGSDSSGATRYPAYSALPTVQTFGKNDNSPMGTGLARLTWGSPGESDNWGAVPGWDACYLANPTANNLLVVRGMADAMSVFPAVCIDPGTNKMLKSSDYTYASLDHGSLGHAGNPCVPYSTGILSVGKLDFYGVQSHNINFGMLANVLYDSDYDREALSFWANYITSLVANPTFNGANNLAMGGEPRAKARTLRTLVSACTLSDNTAYFLPRMDTWISTEGSALSGQTGIHIKQGGAYALIDGLVYGYEIWQQHEYVQAMGSAIRNGFTGMQYCFDYLAYGVFESVLDTPHEYASSYRMAFYGGNGSPSNPVAANFAQCLEFDALQVPSVAQSLNFPENSFGLESYLTAPMSFGAQQLPAAPTIKPAAQVGVAYSSYILISNWLFTNGPLTIVAASGSDPIPSWVRFDVITGYGGTKVYMSGTPTAAGTVKFTLKISDSSTPTPLYGITSQQVVNVAATGSLNPVSPPTPGNYATCQSLALAGDFAGNALSADSTPMKLQEALCECVNFASNKTRANAAWSMWLAHKRSGINAQNLKYNIVPTP